jgi:hypothetical protein
MLLSVALTKEGLAVAAGLSAARMNVIGDQGPKPYMFFTLYLKAYVRPLTTGLIKALVNRISVVLP